MKWESFLNKRAETVRVNGIRPGQRNWAFSRELTLGISTCAFTGFCAKKTFLSNVYPDGYTNKVYFGREVLKDSHLRNDYFHFGSVHTFDVPNKRSYTWLILSSGRKTVFRLIAFATSRIFPGQSKQAEAAFREIEPV